MASLFELVRASSHVTPLLRQYIQCKLQYPEALLLFQVGDFYELFFEDAQKAAAFLGIVLTKRGVVQTSQGLLPIPLCGVPRHTADHYVVKLIKGGFTVVICDQTEVAQPGKLVERAVTQIFTPGIILDDALLQEGRAHYVGSWFRDSTHDALCWYDPLAGVVALTTFTHDQGMCESELLSYKPEELIIGAHETGIQDMHQAWAVQQGYRVLMASTLTTDTPQTIDDWIASLQYSGSRERIDRMRAIPAVQEALSALARYVMRYLPLARQTARTLLTYEPSDYVILDAASMRNLEIFENQHDGTSEHTLFASINKTTTSMGARRLKAWLTQPLRNEAAIRDRQDKIQILIQDVAAREQVCHALKRIGDIERIIGRITLGRALVHDIKKLCEALSAIPELGVWCPYDMRDISSLYMRLRAAIEGDETSIWRIAAGYHAELDRMRALCDQSTVAIAQWEAREQQRTGIATLKVRFIQHQGYAIEVTKQHANGLPPEYKHVQSLTNRERFMHPELLEMAYEVSRAQARVQELEQQLWDELIVSITVQVPLLKNITRSISELDALISLAQVAVEYGYVRPFVGAHQPFQIIQGRHPVVEQHMRRAGAEGQRFIPNDFDGVCRTWIITGPNMGGKSTFLRQVALIGLLAHIGSFVPARFACIPLLDRIYTRLGSGDRLARGESTFYIEMKETARICREATPASLVILDEVGRGTSTHDGRAIAQAVLEYLSGAQPWCIFATHYHELAAPDIPYAGEVARYHAASVQDPQTGQVTLLHKIVPGVAKGSFGIQVARSAQVPEEIVSRAQEILDSLHAVGSGHTQDVENHPEREHELVS